MMAHAANAEPAEFDGEDVLEAGADRVDGELVGRDWNGWEWYPTPEVPGIHAQWLDDADDPTVAVAITPAYESVSDGTRDGVYASRPINPRTKRGYEVICGPTDGDGRTNETILEVFGDVEDTPREVEQAHFDDVLAVAVAWMREHGPESALAAFDVP